MGTCTMDTRLVMISFPESESAENFARRLLDSRLAACVKIVPTITSIYHWEGDIRSDREQLLIIKSCAARIAELEQAVMELHPYTTPEFIVIEPHHVSKDYNDWVAASCA